MVILLSMKNTNRFWIFAVAALLVVMLCGIVAAEEFTLLIDGVPYRNMAAPVFYWEDQLHFSGIADNSKPVYLFLEDPNQNIPNRNLPRSCTGLRFDYESPEITPALDGSWSYTWDSGENSCKYPTSIDIDIVIFGSHNGLPIKIPVTMRAQTVATTIPTTDPTPDYQGQLNALASNVSQQNASIGAHDTMIVRLNETVATQATIVSRHIAITAVPTVNYSATIAALEEKIRVEEAKNREQDNFITQILRFLGLN